MHTTRSRNSRRLIGSACLWVLVSAKLFACDKTPACEAKLSVDGTLVSQRAESKAEALSLACLDYCLKHDALLDGKYRVWKAAGGKSTGSRAKDIEAVAPLKRIRDECQKRCATEQASNVQYLNCPG